MALESLLLATDSLTSIVVCRDICDLPSTVDRSSVFGL